MIVQIRSVGEEGITQPETGSRKDTQGGSQKGNRTLEKKKNQLPRDGIGKRQPKRKGRGTLGILGKKSPVSARKNKFMGKKKGREKTSRTCASKQEGERKEEERLTRIGRQKEGEYSIAHTENLRKRKERDIPRKKKKVRSNAKRRGKGRNKTLENTSIVER